MWEQAGCCQQMFGKQNQLVIEFLGILHSEDLWALAWTNCTAQSYSAYARRHVVAMSARKPLEECRSGGNIVCFICCTCRVKGSKKTME